VLTLVNIHVIVMKVIVDGCFDSHIFVNH